MGKKITACLSVFFILLAGAFTLDRQSGGKAGTAHDDPTVQIQQAEGGTLEEKRPRIFAPREYVKIITPE
jgi:hypothetical protein